MMDFPSREQIEILKERYPVGTQLVVDYMDDHYGIPSGTIVTVESIDSIGQIHVKESGLALVPKVDRFHKK